MKMLLLSLSALVLVARTSADAVKSVDYLREIKPLLKERCYACHGALKQKAELRLDTGQSIRRGGKDEPVVLANDVEKSLLLRRVTSTDLDERMPPEGEALKPEEIARLRSWIAQGAPSPADEKPEPDPREHWAFKALVRPAIPEVEKYRARIANPIDAFIFAGHETRGLTPVPEASREILLRRVYLDLCGLPPSREELAAFLADDAPDAYAKVVERLLGSPQYAQRWARHWMDIWRYADWYGRRHVPDVWNSAPQVWRWRDWIVDSLQVDKGYDRMLGEMLAADEIAPEDDAARVATGYLVRNWYALNANQWMRDIVEHTGKAFLGLTFNCAHCHDHKYDPITQLDYFRFRAFFEPLQVRQDWVKGEPDPGPFVQYKYSEVRKVANGGMATVFDERLDAKTSVYHGGDERNLPGNKATVAPAIPAFLGGDSLKVARIDLPQIAFYPGLKPFIQQAEREKREQALAAAKDASVAAEKSVGEARLRFAEAEVANDVAARAKSFADLLAAEAILRSTSHQLAIAQADMVAIAARVTADNHGGTESATAASRAERLVALRKAEAALAQNESALALLQAEQWMATARRIARAATETNEEKEKAAGALKNAQEQISAARKGVDIAQAALDAASSAFTPLSPKYPAQSTGRRRALASWITSRDHPLTARVAINHIWARHFHAPLVTSVFDFGRNGARPTHPELLDWLAVEFMEHGWSMKHIHRLIVTSSAYRMASSADSRNRVTDPENRYLWRMNAGQMEAEVVRDSILQLAGELDLASGGPPIPNTEAEKSPRRTLYFECFPEPGGQSQFGEWFDAPSPTECYRRSSTIVPQQALALTNSNLSVERSRGVAQRITEKVALTDGDQTGFITAAYEQVLTRRPTNDELAACHEFLATQSRLSKPDAARASLVHVLFNHHDFVTIR